jgi:hypothetical protein
MTAYLATNPVLLFRSLQTWRLKKDMPQDRRAFAMLVNFGLQGCWFVDCDGQKWLLKSGDWTSFHIAHLHDVGPVIGPRDLEAASHRQWAEAWRESMADSIARRLNLPA